MKKNRIASLLVISQNVILAQANEGSETDIETSRRVLAKKKFLIITIALDDLAESMEREGTKERGLSYWRVEGVNTLILVYLIAGPRNLYFVQVLR